MLKKCDCIGREIADCDTRCDRFVVQPVDNQGADLAVDNNPKTRQGALKAPLHLVPPSAEYYLALAFKDGAEKYGAFNWRDEPISVSVYQGAIKRHLAAFADGEDIAEDSGVHHLAHAMACLAMMLDADQVGRLIDDRPTPGGVNGLLAAYHKSQTDG